MTKEKKIIIKNFFSNKFSRKKNILLDKIFDEINQNTKKEKNVFYSLNRNFKLNFKFAELKKYKKFKRIIIIGLGGSTLS